MNHHPDAPCMEYLRTFGEKWLHSRGNVGKYSLHGAFGSTVWVRVFSSSESPPLKRFNTLQGFDEGLGVCRLRRKASGTVRGSGKGKNNEVVVSNIFYFHPYLGKIPILTNIFQMGWNHHLDKMQHATEDPGRFGGSEFGTYTQMLLVWNIYLHLVKNGYIQGEM